MTKLTFHFSFMFFFSYLSRGASHSCVGWVNPSPDQGGHESTRELSNRGSGRGRDCVDVIADRVGVQQSLATLLPYPVASAYER